MTIFYNDGNCFRNVRELENKARPHMNLYHQACINSSSRSGGRSHNISQILSYIDKIRLHLLGGGCTTKSPADGKKSLSLRKSICSQEVVSSCLGKDLRAWRRSPISGTDYSGRDHITVKSCFWIAQLIMLHTVLLSLIIYYMLSERLISNKWYIIECEFKEIAQNGID